MEHDNCLAAFVILSTLTTCVCQNPNQPRGPWTLVFKAVQGKIDSRHASITDFLTSTDTINEESLAARTDFTLSSDIYKSALAHDWTSVSVQAVKLSFFKNNTEQSYAIFDASGKDPTNWFDCSALLDVPYPNFPKPADRDCKFTSDKNKRFFLGGASFCKTGFSMLKDTDASAQLCANLDMLNSHSRPYFLYSSSGNDWNPTDDFSPENDAFDNADSMAIFLQVWVTAMKGGTGSMYDLWTVSTLLNTDVTLSTVTNYKAELVESWSSRFIDQAKFSIYQAGLEKARVVFSAIGSDKNNWFDNTKILYSSYSDLNSSSVGICSIPGQDSRRFLVMKTSGACAAEEAWMAVLDDEANITTLCTWDNVTRPQYFYSNQPTAVLTVSGGAPNPQFTTGDVVGVFVQDWHLVLKVAAGGSMATFASVYDLWTTSGSLNENDAMAKSTTAGTSTYKSFLIDDWSTRYIKAVKLSFYKGGQEVAYIVFDATATTSTDWFRCDRIIYTSYGDFNSTICSVEGDATEKRRFLIGSTTTDCSSYSGWQIIVDSDSPSSCVWEQSGTKPLFLYSSGSDTLASGMQQADAMAVFIDTDECNPNPCKNGGICTDIVADFNCSCTNNYYGIICQNIDGGFSNWTSWGGCSVSCGSDGTQMRSRTCSNPAPEYDGTNCTGTYSETQVCNENVSCPVHGNWSDYTWQPCTVTCGTGTGVATRYCNNPAPAYGGDSCSGSATFEKECSFKPCQCSKEEKEECFWDRRTFSSSEVLGASAWHVVILLLVCTEIFSEKLEIIYW